MLRLAEGDHSVHRGAITLDELDVDDADPAAALADRRHQPHRAGIGRPQEARRHRDRLLDRFGPDRSAAAVRAALAHNASIAPPCTLGPMVQSLFSSPS